MSPDAALVYPFAALVGQTQLLTALRMVGAAPAVGGVLISGERGTAKSTAARALAAVLPPIQIVTGCAFNCDPVAPWDACPHCTHVTERIPCTRSVPFVTLPVGATEDRVLGTLHLERALRAGTRAFDPGLLAAAHRGILFIDEVNLLPDHLVDALLDAVASGVHVVEREGISIAHPARVTLIGTMNPDEGHVRPQLLDRFGLWVTVTAPRDLSERAEIVRRRIAFESDPVAFAAHWASTQAAEREALIVARDAIDRITVDAGLVTTIGHLCTSVGVEGVRADLAMYKAARALAALAGRHAVTDDDVQAAAAFVLPHRRASRPPDLKPTPNRHSTAPRGHEPSGDTSDGGAGNATRPGTAQERIAPAAVRPVTGIRVADDPESSAARAGTNRRGPTTLGAGALRGVHHSAASAGFALDATIRAAAGRRLAGGDDSPAAPGDLAIAVDVDDVRTRRRVGRSGLLVLFLVDASGSMAARRRMEAVKAVVLGLVANGTGGRDYVGVVACRGLRAELLVAPTASREAVADALRALPTGGRTPLAHAIAISRDVLEDVRHARPDLAHLLVVLGDGRANVPLPDTNGDPWVQTLDAAAHLASLRSSAVVVDTDRTGPGRARTVELAAALNAEHVTVDDLDASTIDLVVRRRAQQVVPHA